MHIRKALEFGVTAQWIAATPNGVDAFFAESERNTRALYGEAKRTRQVMPDDIAAQYEKDPEACRTKPRQSAGLTRWPTHSDRTTASTCNTECYAVIATCRSAAAWHSTSGKMTHRPQA